MGGGECDADGGTDVDVQLAQTERSLESDEQPAGGNHGVLRPTHPGQHDREFVAAQSGDGGLGRHDCLKAVGDFDQELIAVLVAERVVHLFEPVQVHDECCHPSKGARFEVFDRFPHPAQQVVAIRQAGQSVVARRVAQLVDQPAVLQRDRSVIRHGLQQANVAGVERADVASPVGHAQPPAQARVALQRHDDRLTVPSLAQVLTRGGI